jgi:hypothetical protein
MNSGRWFDWDKIAVAMAMSRCSENIDLRKDTAVAGTTMHLYFEYIEGLLSRNCYQYAWLEQVKMGQSMKSKPRPRILAKLAVTY